MASCRPVLLAPHDILWLRSRRHGAAQAHQMFTWGHRVREGTLQRSTFRSYMTPLRREVEFSFTPSSRAVWAIG